MRIWSAFVSKNKNTCSCLPRKESVYKKMSLSLDCFCLQRATVCYSGLIWSCCGFLEFSPHIPYSGSFNLFLWWCKEYVKQSCKNMLIMLVSWYYFLVGANFWGRHAKNCDIMSIFWAIFGLFCTLNFGAIVVSKFWLRWVSLLQIQIIQIQNTVGTELDWYPSFMYPKENVNDIMSWWEATKGWVCKRL